MDNLIYAKFEDGEIYHLKDAKIEFFPNQNFYLEMGKNCYGISYSVAPIYPYKVEGFLSNGRAEFKLTFSNIGSEKFFKEHFWIDDIKFILVGASSEGCRAIGKYEK